ncbi:MAG: hypothetical protein VX430_04500 [Pseudomonadota bacterium]|nr:hypothetical protein [Pseudomonadota bacterium]
MGQHKRKYLEKAESRRHAIQLGKIMQSGIDVFCWCNRCGHNATISSAHLATELGLAFAVPEIGSRMRCSGCGSKDVAARPNWPSLGQVARHD